jgi:chemotaxis protein methyltransferase CheR
MGQAECVAFLQWCLPRLGMRWRGFRKVRSQVCKRLARRVRELGLHDLAAYREVLEENEAEWVRVDAMCRITISRFYRDRAVFDAVVDEVMPRLADEATGGRVRCLSCGCASGEEPYTLTIAWRLALAERFPGIELAVIAIDADPHMLDRARAGVYAPRTVRELPGPWRRHAFVEEAGELRVRAPFRESIDWRLGDVRAGMPDGPFDLVLCRNLAFTYFDTAGQTAVLREIRSRVRRGGFLVLGRHETLPGDGAGFVVWKRHLRIFRREDRSVVCGTGA